MLPGTVKILVGVIVVAFPIATWGAEGKLDTAGLPEAKRPVVIQELPEDRFELLLEKMGDLEQTPEARCRRKSMHMLGLVSHMEVSSQSQSLITRLGLSPGSIHALYRTGTDTIYLLEGAFESATHEYIHALDDQYSERLAIAKSGTTDQKVAIRAVVEGTVANHLGTPLAYRSFTTDMDQNSFHLVRIYGQKIVERRAGADLEKAFQIIPKSTYEILWDEVPANSHDFDAPHLEKNEEIVCTDELGVLGVVTALKRHKLPDKETAFTAREWVGDRVDLIKTENGYRVMWQVAFSDPEAVTIWSEAPQAFQRLNNPNVSVESWLAEDIMKEEEVLEQENGANTLLDNLRW